MIKSWIFEQLNISSDENPLHFDASVCSDEYAWRSEMWTQAESQGFHGIFFSEHHFSGVRACPATGLLAASVAARTRRLHIGLLGWVLPMWRPWRLLEEIGVLDQLSQGRLEIGVARGSNPREAVAVGIGEDDILPMYHEALDIIEQSLHSPHLSHRGRYWSFDNLLIAPRPLQRPAPPIWATVRSPEAAARRGHKACTGFLPTPQVVRLFDAYRQAAAQAGRAAGDPPLHFRRRQRRACAGARAGRAGADAVDPGRRHHRRHSRRRRPPYPGPAARQRRRQHRRLLHRPSPGPRRDTHLLPPVRRTGDTGTERRRCLTAKHLFRGFPPWCPPPAPSSTTTAASPQARTCCPCI
ncbi:LLM class flavin-dependent oxidoreductase [Xanthomonas theicola]|uniref:Luciferase-like domain-containing protein n=1 Tax=Xanthomonas theicola TaxID=56464 RepID=A0A2S6ZBU4_9XANT|nr:LLM class flavin-dependent oxidoreductase [Xanthomonas theicola]PPT85387.1 hypothetical protein XthCFBP4691_16285 [Xanthomonas theicola]QNH26360.1 LLM class flavin-dependent oxidoreductase [Xanthomonas theicola]